MQRQAAGLALALLLGMFPQASTAQSVVQKTAIVTLDQDQLYLGTQYGRALQAKFESESAALLAENRKIDAALEAEERDLTTKRTTMTAQDFRPLAEAFDTKANDLRKAQDVKSTELAKSRDADRQAFFQAVAPILGDYMVERGAVAILDKSAIVVSLGSIDITKEVIARIDTRLGDGSKPADPTPAAPIPPAPAP
ncbi:OmpH family outer membrane protein [Cypionkella sp.]|uniref:OmpH family outer membrane protein n=1 Tax=Cypionkella sp. TaxID=2811411 RepID=UPI0027290F03|nr:OmpH family outer membrane protein [Cypionkella sp.]MDO8983899.1 OmpH family outer membrane protein [Cypionkella sp.]MDP2049422.1 OmpH family outer membrane protein [Cypionkella sp.]